MNEFLPRTEPVAPAGSAPKRLATGIRAVASVADAASSADATAGSARAPRATPGRDGAFAVVDDDRVRTVSAYAEVHARIVTVLADLQARSLPDRAASLAAAEGSLLSLMPQPAVVVPLPPANREMVEFVTQVTQSIARQAAQTRAAQSGVSPAMVDIAVV
jgi:hypothetical protein